MKQITGVYTAPLAMDFRFVHSFLISHMRSS